MSNFKSIRDKALDVDPDLRFMALEDFKKKLDPTNATNIEKFVDILFKLLEDQNPDVKNQTIKLFPIILPFVSNKKVVEIVGTLFNQVVTTKENPVSLMVLKLIFSSNASSGSYKFSGSLSRTIIEMILPNLMVDSTSASSSTITNELIEILIELIKSMNQSLTFNEFLSLSNYLINLSFQQVSNSIGKKAVFALNLLLASQAFTVDNEVFDSLLTAIGLNYDKSPKSFNYNYNRLELIFTLVKNLQNLDLQLSNSVVEDIYNITQENIHSKLEDLDYDQILEDNLIKGISMDILLNILNYDIVDPRGVIDMFFDYNPIKLDEDSDEESAISDVDDDVEFSDDEEMEDEIQDFDDGSWKLRLKSIILIKSMNDQTYLPRLLSKIDDKNEFIFKQAIGTINALINGDCQGIVPDIEAKVMKNISNENLLVFSSLIETMLRVDLTLSDGFIINFLQFIENNLKNLELYEVLNLINLIIAKISQPLLSEVSHSLVSHLCNLLDKNSSIIYANLKILNQLIVMLPSADNALIMPALVDKLNDAKLLIDLKIELINSLTLYVLHNELSAEQALAVFEIFKENLNSELMIKPILVNMNLILNKTNVNYKVFIENVEFSNFLTTKLKLYLNSNNKSIYYLILNVFKSLNYSIDSEELMEFGMKEYHDSKIANLIFENLNLNLLNGSTEVNEPFLSKLVNLLNIIKDSEVAIEPLVTQICQQGNYFQFFQQHLDFGNLLSLKVLAIVSVNLNLVPEMELNELKLNDMIDQKMFGDEFVKILQYLSFISLHDHGYTLTKVNLHRLFDLLASDVSDALKFEISKNLGYLIKKDSNLLIEKFNCQDNGAILIDGVKYYYINSIKYYLTLFENKEFETKFWKLLLDEVNIDKIKKEFNLIGETLSIIAQRNQEFTEEISKLLKLDLSVQAVGLSYTLLITINHLIRNASGEELISHLSLESLKYFEIVNVDIKIMLVKNLINLFYNYPMLVNTHLLQICDCLFGELKTYEEFKKIIPMGPYKYVIDEGLEIRKLVFELVYSIINNEQIQKDYPALITEIVTKGLTDNEFDIINLSYTSLSRLITNYPEYLDDYNNLNVMIEKLNKNLNKKLKSKATAQEIEIFQESLKQLINLSYQINGLLVKYNWSYSNWEVYFNTVKKFGDVNT